MVNRPRAYSPLTAGNSNESASCSVGRGMGAKINRHRRPARGENAPVAPQTLEDLFDVSGRVRPTDELSLAEWHEVLAVNLDGSFLVGREAARAFKTGTGGKLIFTSSVWGLAGARGVPLAAYAASKGGVVNLVRQLALE